ncbi:hypothetical protein EDB84DRAFT_1441882 [Lactarius hengduanensis]|nr:hypothetical protein EDB84DRAFT_1441882 [Lactarius hengduanensis]
MPTQRLGERKSGLKWTPLAFLAGAVRANGSPRTTQRVSVRNEPYGKQRYGFHQSNVKVHPRIKREHAEPNVTTATVTYPIACRLDYSRITSVSASTGARAGRIDHARGAAARAGTRRGASKQPACYHDGAVARGVQARGWRYQVRHHECARKARMSTARLYNPQQPLSKSTPLPPLQLAARCKSCVPINDDDDAATVWCALGKLQVTMAQKTTTAAMAAASKATTTTTTPQLQRRAWRRDHDSNDKVAVATLATATSDSGNSGSGAAEVVPVDNLSYILSNTKLARELGLEKGSVRVQTGFNVVLTFCAVPEPWTELMVRFCTTAEPWTGLRSSSKKFGFELWFRTGLQHP